MQFKAGAIITIGMLLATFSYYFYQLFFTANLRVDKEDAYLYIPTGATFEIVTDSLNKYDVLNDKISFYFLSKLLKYREQIKPGKYLLQKNMSNWEAIKMLKRGRQTPVKLTFNNVRLKTDLAEKVDAKLELSASELNKSLSNEATAKNYGFTAETFMCMFIPNTYEMYWTISTKDFLDKMHKEYQKFWNAERTQKAKSIGMTPVEVIILASIVEAETNKNDEKP